MARHIDAEALGETIKQSLKENKHAKGSVSYSTLEKFLDVLKYVPTADVVEVVRCKECKHATGSKIKCSMFDEVQMDKNHFCSYGERKPQKEV